MSAKPTPGPWTPHNDGHSTRIKAGDFIVAQMPVRKVTLVEQNEANARLIAAAPDDLAVAKEAYVALLSLEHGTLMRIACWSVLAHLRDFIAKAEGRKPEDVQGEFEALYARKAGGDA